ncbi:MAG TPA: hypothetical protein VF590_20110 [Isosphaeraceae bacterium]|jgi:hypothetical protein
MPFWIYGHDARTGERRDPLFVETDDEAEARTAAAEAGMAVEEVETVDRAEPVAEAPPVEPPPWEETGDWPGRIQPDRPSWTAVSKRRMGMILGGLCALLGIWLRLSAHALAWSSSFSYSGPREATDWAIAERAYEELGRIALGFGLVMVLLVFVHWLWDRPRRPRERRRRRERRRSPEGTGAGPRPAG